MASRKGLVYILDMGSTLADAVARRLIDFGQYMLYRPWDMTTDVAGELNAHKDVLKGIIISGSSKNINSKRYIPPHLPVEVLQANVPILAICYGMQYLAHVQGIRIIRCWDEQDISKRTKAARKKDKGEQGPVMFHRTAEGAESPLFAGLGDSFPVWMKHNWMLEGVPERWGSLGRTDKCPVAAMQLGNIYALQFHPEPYYSLSGRIILNNFITRICQLDTPYY